METNNVNGSWLARMSAQFDRLLFRMGLRRQEPREEGVSRISATTLKVYAATVILPLILYSIYVYFIRSPGYLSEAQVVVQLDPTLSNPSVDLGLIFSGPSGGLVDALLIKAYIESRALLVDLDGELKLREHYSDRQHDIFSRLAQDATREKFLDFYGSRVVVVIDSDSLIIRLSVEAYTREYAKQLAESIVRHASEFVNGISQTIARDQMAFVQQELENSNQRLRKASEELLKLQKKNALLSPEAEALTLGSIIAALQSDLAARRAQLTAMRSYLNDNAPEVVAQREGISALEHQIEQERAKETGTAAKDLGKGLTDLFLDYQAAQTAVKVASDAYQGGLITLQAARLEASRTAKHLVEVSGPSLPDDSLVPRRFYSIATAFFLLNIGFFILSLIAAAIRDHRDA